MGRFLRRYAPLFHNPALWPTRDGVIPYKTFFLLIGALDEDDALTELVVANAVSLGYTWAREGKANTALATARRRLVERAFPKVDEG